MQYSNSYTGYTDQEGELHVVDPEGHESKVNLPQNLEELIELLNQLMQTGDDQLMIVRDRI